MRSSGEPGRIGQTAIVQPSGIEGHRTNSPRRCFMPGIRKETTPITVDTPWFRSGAVELGDLTVAFETIREERDSAPAFKGLPDDSCLCPHLGLVTSVRSDENTDELTYT